MTCPLHEKHPLCTTCRLGGLGECPLRAVRLPLVEGERPVIEVRRRVLPEELSQEDRELLYRYMKAKGHFE